MQDDEKGEESDEDLKGLDDKLKNANLDKESKLIIHGKLSSFDNIIQKTLDEKAKQLEEKLQGNKKK